METITKASEGWDCITFGYRRDRKETPLVNIVPVKDLKLHLVSEACLCKPSIKWECITKIIIHNAWDGREFYE